MGRRLKDSITSDYLSAANRLNSRQARHRIVAYVESYDDVFFWRTVLSSFETDSYYFQVMLPSRSRQLNRGKKAALMRLMTDRVGSDMIACVDADYDYLIQKATPTSQQIIDSPYVFHTYAYAISTMSAWLSPSTTTTFSTSTATCAASPRLSFRSSCGTYGSIARPITASSR